MIELAKSARSWVWVDESGNSGRKKSTTMRVAESFRNQFLLKSSDGNLRSSCNGDSGGPLFIGEGASRVLVGVSSWGPRGCQVDDSFYVSVNDNLDWILENLNGPTSGVRQKQVFWDTLMWRKHRVSKTWPMTSIVGMTVSKRQRQWTDATR